MRSNYPNSIVYLRERSGPHFRGQEALSLLKGVQTGLRGERFRVAFDVFYVFGLTEALERNQTLRTNSCQCNSVGEVVGYIFKYRKAGLTDSVNLHGDGYSRSHLGLLRELCSGPKWRRAEIYVLW